MRVGAKAGQYGWSFTELRAVRAAAADSGFQVLACFDHVSAAPDGQAAWDAPTLLVAIAAATSRIELAVDVLNASLRHPFLLASQLAVAQAASGGWLRVGLGAGSYHFARFDHQALGIAFPPFAERIRWLEACCRVLPSLWRGEQVSEPALGLEEASLGPIGIRLPPIVVGGASDRVLVMAARWADALDRPGHAGPAGLGETPA